jgi:hypothetical protein
MVVTVVTVVTVVAVVVVAVHEVLGRESGSPLNLMKRISVVSLPIKEIVV